MGHRDTIRQQSQQNRHLITYDDPRSPISEQYRTIRTNIQYASVEEELRAILVTSAGAGDGKSTTVGNLAVVMAQQGNKVLLMDTDLRKPTVHYIFKQSNNRGLTNILTHQKRLEECTLTTEVENLYILPSGPIPPNPAELLGTKTMHELVEETLQYYDFVLFDSPPVLAVTDAQILTDYCDGVVLVVSSGKTGREEAVKAKELLTHAHAKLLGVVLNEKKQKQNDYNYYYGKK